MDQKKQKRLNDICRFLAGAVMCLAGFVVVISNISNGSDRLSLDRLGIWYAWILLLATVICICCSVISGKYGFVLWARENWPVALYLILRIVSGAANGVISKEAFFLSLCSEAFLLLAINTTSVSNIAVKITLCIIIAFDLIAISFCVFHNYCFSEQAQSIVNTYGQGMVNKLPFSLVFYNPNSAGLLAGFTAAVLITALFKGYQSLVRVLLFPLIFINLVFIIWADCRTALVGVAVVCAMILLNKTVRGADFKRLLSITVICCIAMLIPVYVMTFISDSQRNTANSGVELQLNEISSGRYNIWKQHIISQKGHYLTGFATNKRAIDARVEMVRELEENGISVMDENLSAAQNPILGVHNGYLELILLTGLPGFLLIMVYIYMKISSIDNRFTSSHPEVMILVYLFLVCTQESRFITSGLNYITLLMMLLLNYGTIYECRLSETGREEYSLCRGVKESSVYVTDGKGLNVKTHILRIASDNDVSIKVVCGGPTASQPRDTNLRMLSRQARDYNGSGNVVAALSGGFYDLGTGVPLGTVVEEGCEIANSKEYPFFAVLRNGRQVIRKAGGKVSDAAEAVSGNRILISKGKIKVKKSKVRHPRQAIGICGDGTLVIANVEGRQPDSGGMSLYGLAELMKEQGCVDAINLDGGGSAGFMTRRADDKKPLFRNTPGDGFERNISSALLVICSNDKEGQPLQTEKKVSWNSENSNNNPVCAPYMFSSKTVLDRTVFGRYTYRINGEEPSGLYNINGKSFLFRKGKGLSRKITIGETSYLFKKGIYCRSSDPEAGNVLFGYCGIEEYGGKNLVFALHTGNWIINIGLNPDLHSVNGDVDADPGEMDDWLLTQERRLPWYAFRHCIRNVYIADGVTSIGSRFLYMPEGEVKGRTRTPINALETVRLPASLNRIGAYAFYNKPLLKSVTIPSGVTETEINAFDKSVSLDYHNSSKNTRKGIENNF